MLNMTVFLILENYILWIHLISRIPIFVDKGQIVFLRVFNFEVVQRSTYKPIENLKLGEYLNSWFTYSNEIHEHWYQTNKMKP